jgi:hypothetical protein
MFTHMRLDREETHQAHNSTYDLMVYQVIETGAFRIYIPKPGVPGEMFTASEEIVRDARSGDVIGEIILLARDDIDRNEFGLY